MPVTEYPLSARHGGPHVIFSNPILPDLLPPEATSRLREEAALVERFVECYQRQFDALIRRLNATATPPAAPAKDDPHAQSLRLCVEAVNMMLATHGQMARALRQLGVPAGRGDVRHAAPRAAPAGHAAPGAAAWNG